MVNNINNFGVINFYESNSTNSKKEQAKPQQVEDITPFHEENNSKKEQAYTIPVPKENDYNSVREYIEERKKTDKEFRLYWESHTLKQSCIFLSKEFGWIVDEHSLGANLNRHR